MSDIAIRVEDLGKKYRLGGSRRSYRTVREAITDAVTAPMRRARGLLQGEGLSGQRADEFWALRDVSFEVKRGEVVGIIGRNGAGKSTLLKILARITKPTTGYADIYGRVGSLLEVGTGFHPELSGRENIYLSGAVLGMKRAEIDRRFDEIVDFAEVEKFIDTPVKHYSSGMYLRLAFAVAAHLEPEILLVDEVLAVGDAAFQKKCLGKMGNVAREGRTVLFVSHNMAAVQQLCQEGVVLNNGNVTFIGGTEAAVTHYMNQTEAQQTTRLVNRTDRQGSQWLKFTRVELCDSTGTVLNQILSGQDLFVRLYYKSQFTHRDAQVLISFNVRSKHGYLLTNLNAVDTGDSTLDINRHGYFECAWPRFNLRSGRYDCNIFCSVNGEIVDWIQSAFVIQAEDGDYFETGRMIDRTQGDVLIPHSWSSYAVDEPATESFDK